MNRRFPLRVILFFAVFAASCTPLANSSSGGPGKPQNPVTNTLSVAISNNVINSLNPLFFGHNYYGWPTNWGNPVAGTVSIIKPLNIKLMRAGGQNNDAEDPEPLDTLFMDNYNSYISNIGGAAPFLQLPLAGSPTMASRVVRATNILSYYINTKGYSLNWVAIGNEPDVYNVTTPSTDMTNFNTYINSFTNVAAAVKKAYPSLNIAGPDLAYDYNKPGTDFLTRFLQNCRNYVNTVTIHYYPANADSLATYDFATNQFDFITNSYSTILKTIADYGSGQSLIIGECQISWDGNPANPVAEASLGTIEAGLWFADFAGISGSQPKVISIMPWSVCESYLTSFLDIGSGNKPRPVYYVYYLFSNHALSNMVLCSKPAADIRVYAYEDASGNASVYCVNWNRIDSYSITFNFTGGLLHNTNIAYTFAPLSLTCLSISADLSQRTAYTYSSADAAAGQGIETNNF